MMLREGIDVDGESIALDGLADPDCTRIEGIDHSEILLRFANAFMSKDEAELSRAREQLVDEMGVEAMVDAVGVASNFQRAVRIADATGIRSDEPFALMHEDLQELIGTDKYVSAVNTKPIPWIKRLLIKLIVIPKIRKQMKEKRTGQDIGS